MNPLCLHQKARVTYRRRQALYRVIRRHLDFSRKYRHKLRRDVNGLEYVLKNHPEQFITMLYMYGYTNVSIPTWWV